MYQLQYWNEGAASGSVQASLPLHLIVLAVVCVALLSSVITACASHPRDSIALPSCKHNGGYLMEVLLAATAFVAIGILIDSIFK